MMLVGTDSGSLRARWIEQSLARVNKWREAAFIFSCSGGAADPP